MYGAQESYTRSFLFEPGAVFDGQRDGFGRLMNWYSCALMETETKFEVLNREFSMRYDRNPIADIRTRLKSPASIKEKLDSKGLEMTLENITDALDDVAGVRVICSFADDVYALEQALLKQDDVTLLERNDYIASPKKSGYKSLHLVIGVPIFLSDEKRVMKVEIQLRTIAMDAWAALEHQLRYKKNRAPSEELDSTLRRCGELIEEFDGRMNGLLRAAEREEAK